MPSVTLTNWSRSPLNLFELSVRFIYAADEGTISQTDKKLLFKHISFLDNGHCNLER